MRAVPLDLRDALDLGIASLTADGIRVRREDLRELDDDDDDDVTPPWEELELLKSNWWPLATAGMREVVGDSAVERDVPDDG